MTCAATRGAAIRSGVCGRCLAAPIALSSVCSCARCLAKDRAGARRRRRARPGRKRRCPVCGKFGHYRTTCEALGARAGREELRGVGT